MSDFVFSSAQSMVDALSQRIGSIYPDKSPDLYRFSGPWGALVVSENPYHGFEPIETETHIFAVVGGPLLRFRDNDFLGKERGGEGARALYERWLQQNLSWSEDLSGPFVVVIADKRASTLSVTTDLMSFIPVFACDSDAGTIIGTHVDVVAGAAGREGQVDRASMLDFVINGTVTYPYTLFHGVEQIAPASVHIYGLRCGRATSESSEFYWLPRPENPFENIEEASEALHKALSEFVRDAVSGMAQVAVFISGGEDSRLVLSLVPASVPRDAYIFLNGMNREGKVARKAAEIFGATFHYEEREGNRYLKMLPECSTLVGSGAEFMHAHMYGHHESSGLDRYSGVLGGYASDRLIKGRYARKLDGSGRILFVPEIRGSQSQGPDVLPAAFDWDTREEVSRRRWAHWGRVRALRGESSADEWFVIWPFSMADTAPNIHSNRRLFRSYEPFLDARVVKIAANVPQQWKLNRRLFRLAAREPLKPAGKLLHTNGWHPLWPFWINSPLRLFFRLLKSLKKSMPGVVAHQGPWADRRVLMNDELWSELTLKVCKDERIRSLCSGDQDFETSFNAMTWGQKMNLFQVAFNLGYLAPSDVAFKGKS